MDFTSEELDLPLAVLATALYDATALFENFSSEGDIVIDNVPSTKPCPSSSNLTAASLSSFDILSIEKAGQDNEPHFVASQGKTLEGLAVGDPSSSRHTPAVRHQGTADDPCQDLPQDGASFLATRSSDVQMHEEVEAKPQRH